MRTTPKPLSRHCDFPWVVTGESERKQGHRNVQLQLSSPFLFRSRDVCAKFLHPASLIFHQLSETMSWEGFVKNFMANNCQDAAVIGYPEHRFVWAAHPGGTFANITTAEIDALVSKDRQSFFITGVTLGNEKCSVIRDRLEIEEEWGMDLRTKSSDGGPTFNISVGKSHTAIIVIKGKEGVHGGCLNKLAFDTVEYLRKSDC